MTETKQQWRAPLINGEINWDETDEEIVDIYLKKFTRGKYDAELLSRRGKRITLYNLCRFRKITTQFQLDELYNSNFKFGPRH